MGYLDWFVLGDPFPRKTLSDSRLGGLSPSSFLDLWGHVACPEQHLGDALKSPFKRLSPDFASWKLVSVTGGDIKIKEGVDLV